MKQIQPSTFLLSLLLAAGTLAPAMAQESPQYYQVEIIVLKHLDQSRTTPEIPRIAAPEIADILDQDLPRMDQPGNQAGIDEAEEANPVDVYLLDEGRYLLKDVESRLRKAGAYQILAHRSWLQTAPEAADAWDLNLADIAIDPAVAAGQVKLYQRRYLHLTVAMSLGATADSNPLGSAFQAVRGPVVPPSIADSRRIRLENLVYFDQPQFGVLAYVARSDFAPGKPGE